MAGSSLQDLNYEILSRNVQIYNEFTSGATHAQLVQKYKISLQQVYSVIKKVREELRKNRAIFFQLKYLVTNIHECHQITS